MSDQLKLFEDTAGHIDRQARWQKKFEKLYRELKEWQRHRARNEKLEVAKWNK